jgi:hypothetical protein
MSRSIPTLVAWPLRTPLPRDAQLIVYVPDEDDEFRVVPEQVSSAQLYQEAGQNATGAMSQQAATAYADRGPNYVPAAAYKQVTFLTRAEAIAANRPTVATLDELDPLTLCTGTVVRVDLYPGASGTELLLVYDDRPNPFVGLRAYIDGNFKLYKDLTSDGLNPQKWVKKGSVEAMLAGIRRYSATYAKWGKDETMKIDFGGTDAFFSAINAGGPFPAPTAAGVATADWKPAAEPTAPTPGNSLPTGVLSNVPTAKALAVIAAYQAAGGPVEETDAEYFGQDFIDDFTEPGDEYWYVCRPRRPLTAGQPTTWKWGRYLEFGV